MEHSPPESDRRPVCHADVCVTCSDEAVPVRVVRLLPGDLALCDTGVSTEEISVALVDAAVGATVLVHAKEAIAVIDDRDDPRDREDGGGGGTDVSRNSR